MVRTRLHVLVNSVEVVVEKYNPWKNSMVSGVLLLIVGILLAALQGEGLKWIIILAGVLMLVYGALSIYDTYSSGFKFGMTMGIVVAVIGLVLIIVPNLIADIAMALLALLLIIVGLMSLLGAAPGFAIASGSRLVSIIVGVIFVVLGVVAIFNLDDTADVIMIVIGVMTALMGLLQIFSSYQLKKVC